MVPQTRANIFICLLDHTYKAPLANIKMERQKWPVKPLIFGRSGTQYVAMVTKLLSLYCGAHLVESYCKESNISDTNCLRYLSWSYLIKIWLSVWCHQLTNLHISKTQISLEQKEIFENSKQHFYFYTDYFFYDLKWFDWNEAIFIIVKYHFKQWYPRHCTPWRDEVYGHITVCWNSSTVLKNNTFIHFKFLAVSCKIIPSTWSQTSKKLWLTCNVIQCLNVSRFSVLHLVRNCKYIKFCWIP